jgi:threonine synthase
MGLPIDTLVIAANVNDILPRAIASGRYEVRRVTATSSPSMDIQVSSNFERLLFEAYGRDAGAIRALMKDLADKGSFEIAADALTAIRDDFAAGSADEAETVATIKRTYAATGFLPDPHTAVGLAVAERFAKPGVPMVTLATAHPAKFPEAIKAATGIEPELPPSLAGILRRDEQFDTLPADGRAVADFIAARSRAAKLAEGVGQ